MTLAVVGAGAFGTALAISLSEKTTVTLWARSAEHAAEMQKTRVNSRRLPNAILPQRIQVTADIEQAAASDTVLIAVPMQRLRELCAQNADELRGKNLIACCKGIELDSHHGPVRIIEDEAPGARAAILTGPSFAKDIASGLPTALTLACKDADVAQDLQRRLTTSNLRLYTTTDTTGAELGGALKNVMAIACGAVMGAGLGESARAALMTRGFAEMTRLAMARGADPRTLSGLSGFGDLVLTCSSHQSRNYQMGLALGSGSKDLPEATVEGVATAKSVAGWAREDGLDLPIATVVAQLVSGSLQIEDAIAALMSRPLKPE